ncbi:DUF6624 domain-containing protein [Pseudonocardia charpentierae]|uniref:DUF6624 domain-containing protein n=1 Tax=Pseudonocardia charpentierae TaxID=3075545 RepID=UPI00288B1A4A|nr:DUF6624 domain-containing protein [Pseudonocardia sp. DSM 45834]
MEDAELRDELLRRAEVDQQARRACTPLFAKARDGMVHPDDLAPDEQAIVDRLTEVDRDNTRWLGELVERRGWPTHSLVGEQAAVSAWLLAQHADQDPALQRRCLDLMCAAPTGDVTPMYTAYLTDRVLLAEGKSQVYGTQVTLVDGEYQPLDLRDPETVDERRAVAGLCTLAEYRRTMHEES